MQIIIFSISGIITLSLNNCLASLLGSFYESYFGYAPVSEIEISLNFLLAIMLILLMISYGFVYSSRMLNTSCSPNLPEISLSSYVVLIRLLPLFFVWFFYVAGALYLLEFIFPAGFLRFICKSFIIVLVPFVWIIFIYFSRNFEYKRTFFQLQTLFLIIKQYGVKVISLFLQVFIWFLFLIFLMYWIFNFAEKIQNPLHQMILRIFALCFLTYGLNVLNLSFLRGLVDFINKNDIKI